MGSVKDISSHPDPQAFPGATFLVEDTPPAPQCADGRVKGDNGTIASGTAVLDDFQNFIGWNLTGRKCYIKSPPEAAGIYNILSNTDDDLTLDHTFPDFHLNVVYYCANGGGLTKTVKQSEFAAYLSSVGAPYTIKGGILYTSALDAVMAYQCIVIWNPLS